MDAIDRFAAHVADTRFEDLPDAAVAAARTYVLDSLGVGLIGSIGPWASELVDQQSQWGEASQARVWGFGTALPAPAAAMCNAYQMHNSEYDCVHEDAVVHAFSAVLPGMLAVAERDGCVGGRDLILGLALGVDVACHVSVAVKSGLRFFRPATAGALAATAGIGKLRGFDKATLVNAFSIVYGQICGTMQAHVEGSQLLAMQMAFNARNAVIGCDMAAAGFEAPKNVLEGPFGYLRLIEGEYDLEPIWPELGRTWRIAQMAHKPFPTGRASHGILEGLLALMKQHDLSADDVEQVTAAVPPLVHRLVSRPAHSDMTVNYARLSVPYAGACALLGGGLSAEDFTPDALRDPRRLALAQSVSVELDGNPDPNALTPLTVSLTLRGGQTLSTVLDSVYGSPAKPMSREAHLRKFRDNCAAAVIPRPRDDVERLIALTDALPEVGDVRALVDLVADRPAT